MYLKNKNLESILPLKWINDAENSTFKITGINSI